LRILFNHARRHGLAITNPAESVQARASDAEERIPFTEEQIKALLEIASPEWRGMILLGLHAGLRISDAANLSWANIDLSARMLSYQPRKTSRRKKPRERTTTIWLHDDLVTYLAGLPAGDVPDTPLFPSLARSGAASGASGYSALFGALMTRAGVHGPAGVEKSGKGRRFSPLSFHSLRHTFVSRLANLEVSHDLRKELVGHASDAIHDRYTHLDINLQRIAIGKLPSAL
jgi:integrase